ncbi:MAG TPA: hypothetical protein VF813_08710, partial [Anaerolineaceae bacterium]
MKRNAHLILLFALAMLAACSPPVSRTAASPLGAPAAATPIPTTYAYGKEVTAKYTIRGGPFGITAGFGSLWVTGRRAHQLYRVDPASGEIRASIPVGLAPGPVIAAADSLWVGNFGTNPGEQSIARVDPQKE